MGSRVLAVVLIGLAALVVWGVRGVPPSSFEPLGSAAFPRALAILIALLAVPLLFERATAGRPQPGAGDEPAEAVEPRPLMAVWLMAAAAVFVLVLQMRVVGFAVSTTVFLTVVMSILTRFSRRALLPTLAIAAATGFGLEYVFTRILVTYLP